TQLPGALEKAKTVFKDFSFSARGSSVSRIAILIFEENIGKPQSNSIIEGDIVKQLLASKYKVIDKNEVYRAISREQAKASAESGDDAAANAIKSMADVLVIGYAKAMESVGGSTNPYGGGTSNRVSAWADCSIRVVDLETGKVLASSDIQREKGLSVGAAEKAGIIALQNLSKKASKEIVDNMNAALK
ncbi:MAG TPA: CsgG/HfaB family protein, partial [bacterium]|nr:CsgG/HfaB family protein [bacterium]